MVEIPDTLRSVFSGTIHEDDGTFMIEVPTNEVAHDAIQSGETYRIAVFESPTAPSRAEQDVSDEAEHSDIPQRGPPEPPVNGGERRDVTIETVGDQGDGIAKVDRGYVVIVPDAQPGDEPTVEIEQVQENVAFASIVDPDPRTL